MAPDRPVASVSGGQDWAWNRWQAERQSRQSSPAVTAARTRDRWALRDGPGRPRHRYRRDGRQLERELERTEQRLQSVITRYERILTEKNRQLAEETEEEPATGGLQAALSAVARRLALR